MATLWPRWLRLSAAVCIVLTLDSVWSFASRTVFIIPTGYRLAEAQESQSSFVAGRARAMSLLQRARPQRAAQLFLFTDPGRDPDDLVALVASKSLQDQGIVDLRGVVTTLGGEPTRVKRAQLAKSVLVRLGMTGTAVGVGTHYRATETGEPSKAVTSGAADALNEDHESFLNTPLLDTRATVELDGQALLRRELARVSDHSAVLLVNSGLTDLAVLLEKSPELVRKKVGRIVIMGGVEGAPDQRGFLVADNQAYNNTTDQRSADSAYIRIQTTRVPLLVVNREAAYAVAVSPAFYDELAGTGNPIGIVLKEQQMQSLGHLWAAVRGRASSSRLNTSWFFKTFTDVNPETPEGKVVLSRLAESSDDSFARIWLLVKRLNIYDVVSLLAATPGVAEQIFRPEIPTGRSTDVGVVGGSAVTDATLVRDIATILAVDGLTRSLPRH